MFVTFFHHSQNNIFLNILCLPPTRVPQDFRCDQCPPTPPSHPSTHPHPAVWIDAHVCAHVPDFLAFSSIPGANELIHWECVSAQEAEDTRGPRPASVHPSSCRLQLQAFVQLHRGTPAHDPLMAKYQDQVQHGLTAGEEAQVG